MCQPLRRRQRRDVKPGPARQGHAVANAPGSVRRNLRQKGNSPMGEPPDPAPADVAGDASGRRFRSPALWATLGVIIVAAAIAAAFWLRTPRITAGPMVQLVRPDGFTLVWAQKGAREPRAVLVRPDGSEVPATPRAAHGYLQAEFTGLEPSTDCTYRIEAGTGPGREVLFEGRTRTAPQPGEPLRILAFGDSGDGSRSQYALARRMRDYSPDVILHTGDLVYPGGERSNYRRRFFVPYADLISRAPLYPVIGNHDMDTENGAPLREVFVLPSNGPAGVEPEHCYFVEMGDALFVGVNSCLPEDVLRDAVAPWLAEVLRNSPALWKFVCWHHAVFTGSRHEPFRPALEHLVPAVERGGADFVLNGHNHLYERTRPLRGGQIVPAAEGTVYVTTGAGGARRYAITTSRDYIAAAYDADFSFTVIDISAGDLRLRQINLAGQVVDEWYAQKEVPADAQADVGAPVGAGLP